MIVSVPSYVFPGTYLENLRFLATLPWVRSVELLFFVFDDETRQLLEAEIEEITRYRDRLGITVHLPDPLEEHHETLLRMTREVACHYVVHPPGEEIAAFSRLLRAWQERHGATFVLENVKGRSLEKTLEAVDLSLCCDTGHLLLEGDSPVRFLERYGDRVREIHLHGVAEGVDHRPLDAGEPWARELAPHLASFRGTLHLETFSLDGVTSSYGALLELMDMAREGVW